MSLSDKMSSSTGTEKPSTRDTIILLAEDGEIVRKMVKEILTGEGYTVIPTADGREAYDYFRKNSNKIDLIVTDIVMPNMDGRELGQQCRERTPNIGILYMSGYADSRIDPERDLARNADFIAKPFHPADFVEKVKSLLDSK